MCTEFTKKKVFGQLTLAVAPLACRHHGRQKVLIHDCNLISLSRNETALNLKSASFVVIMLLHEGLTHIQSQIKPQLLFGESFTLSSCRHLFTGIMAFLFSIWSLHRSSKKDNLQPSHSIPHFSLATCSTLSQADEHRKRIMMVLGGSFGLGMGARG